jgi:hypothetical protein
LNALAAQPLGASWSQGLPGTPQNYSITANVTKSTTGLTVQNAEARVAPPGNGGAAMAEVKLLQVVTIPASAPGPANTTAPWPVLTGDLLAVQLAQLPVGVLGLALPGYEVRGNTVSADLLVRGEGAGVYSLAAQQPLTISQLSVRKNYETMVDSLTVGLRPVAKFSQAGLVSVAVYDLAISSATKDLVNGRVECTFKPDGTTPAQAKFDLAANCAALLNQPFLKAYSNLNSGQGTLSGELAADGTFKLDADFTQWSVRDPARVVQEIAIKNATGKIGPNSGAVQVTAPISGAGPNGATSCSLNLTLTPSPDGKARTFSLNLTGDGLVPDDLMALKNGFSPPGAGATARPPGAPPAPVASTEPETEPMWGNTTGTAQVNLKRLAFAAMDLSNLNAAAQVTPTQAMVSKFSAQLPGGAPVTFNGGLTFDASQAQQPYALQANLNMTDFDTGAYFRAHDPKAKVPLEGKFSINGTTSGRGANADDLIARVPFDFKLTSSGGTIYVLSMVNKGGEAALTGLSVASGVAGIFGGILGGKAPNVSQFSQALSQLTSLFDKIQYTSMTFEATRGADRNINLTQINVQSPDIIVNGSGRIQYRAGTPIPGQPLNVNVQLGVKGNPAQLLGTLGLMQSNAPDSKGYMMGPQFQVGGTLQKPDYQSFYQLLIQAPMRMLKIGM